MNFKFFAYFKVFFIKLVVKSDTFLLDFHSNKEIVFWPCETVVTTWLKGLHLVQDFAAMADFGFTLVPHHSQETCHAYLFIRLFCIRWESPFAKMVEFYMSLCMLRLNY